MNWNVPRANLRVRELSKRPVVAYRRPHVARVVAVDWQLLAAQTAVSEALKVLELAAAADCEARLGFSCGSVNTVLH